ncbi:MAG: hypothetical protein C4318_01200 [Acidimicrobiia bacterium]
MGSTTPRPLVFFPKKLGLEADRQSASETDAGSIALFVALSMLGLATVASTMARSGIALIDRAKADAVAEAAALSAVAGVDAGVVAQTNGGSLVAAVRQQGGEWVVRVRVGRMEAVAAATYGGLPSGASPKHLSGGFKGKRTGLSPETLAALEKADALLAARGMPSPVPVVSGLRSLAEQQALWARRFFNPYPVAPPGTSAHERGLAVDIPPDWVPYVVEVSRQAGLCQPYPNRDPIHFGPIESPECGGNATGSRGGRPILIPLGEA